MNKPTLGWLVASLGVFLSGGSLAEEAYFSKTELYVHAEVDRQPADTGIWTLTFEHFSEWRYGDNFFFLDLEGEPDYAAQAETLYFEFAPRLSLDRVLQTDLLSPSWLGEVYATVQYNDSDRDFINRVWLYGLSVDFAGQPHHGFSNLHVLLREEDTQDLSWQVTLAWGQPFRLGGLALGFQGFLDLWENDAGPVILAEPQLVMPLRQWVGPDHLLAHAAVGTEIEISKNFFGPDHGWEVNPTLFFRLEF